MTDDNQDGNTGSGDDTGGRATDENGRPIDDGGIATDENGRPI